MDRRFQLGEHVVAHFVTAGTEFLRVGDLQRGVEPAPEDHARHETGEHEYPEAEHGARPAQHIPQIACEVEKTAPPPRRCFCYRHRRSPGCVRESSASMSTKSLSTGAFVSCCGTWHCVQKKRRGDTEARNCPSRSMKCVIDSIGARLSPVRARAWHDRHLLPLRST